VNADFAKLRALTVTLALSLGIAVWLRDTGSGPGCGKRSRFETDGEPRLRWRGSYGIGYGLPQPPSGPLQSANG
jgi:hypothetical protein